MTNKPTRDDIQQALQEGAKPDADIDDPDEIPETTSTRKRKVQASESNDSQNSKKQKGNEDSSSSSSSSSPMDAKGAGGVPKIDKSPAEVVPKSKTAPSAKSTTAGRGRGGPKLLDTSNVVPHLRPEVFQRGLDRGRERDDKKLKEKSAPAPKKKK